MSRRHWMPVTVADYMADTGHLTTAEHGAYWLLICHYWTHDGLPDDEVIIRRITKMTIPQWAKSRASLKAFFYDGWKHRRLEAEIGKAIEKSRVNSANAQRRHCERTATAQRTDTQLTSTVTEERKEPICIDSNVAESPEGLPTKYAFEGKVIRLNQKDFSNWVKGFPELDLRGVLLARDAWLAESASDADRKKWFVSTPQYLSNLNLKAKAQREGAASAKKWEWKYIEGWQ